MDKFSIIGELYLIKSSLNLFCLEVQCTDALKIQVGHKKNHCHTIFLSGAYNVRCLNEVFIMYQEFSYAMTDHWMKIARGHYMVVAQNNPVKL